MRRAKRLAVRERPRTVDLKQIVEGWRGRLYALADKTDEVVATRAARRVFGEIKPIVWCWSPLACVTTIAFHTWMTNRNIKEYSISGATELDLLLDSCEEFTYNIVAKNDLATQIDTMLENTVVGARDPSNVNRDIYASIDDAIDPGMSILQDVVDQRKAIAPIVSKNLRSLFGTKNGFDAGVVERTLAGVVERTLAGARTEAPRVMDFLEDILHTSWASGDVGSWNKFQEHRRCVMLDAMIKRGGPLSSMLSDYLELAGRVYLMMIVEDVVYLVANPKAVRFDARGRFHSTTDPAIEWVDGLGLHFIEGIRVPAGLVADPKRFVTLQRIQDEGNLEVRRLMIDRFKDGLSSYLEHVEADVIDQSDWGTLYEWNEEDERGRRLPIFAVVVENSTLEPDGTRKKYALKVDQRLRPMKQVMRGGTLVTEYGAPQDMSALNAVASTFGMTGPQYKKVLKET